MPLRFSIANYYETYSENEELQKIDEFDVRHVVDAQILLNNYKSVMLAVADLETSSSITDASGVHGNDSSSRDIAIARSASSSATSALKKIRLNLARDVISHSFQDLFKRKPKSSIPPPLPIETPDYPRTPTPEHFTPAHDHIDEVRRERFYLSQPYRTTPLVLPGAKIKKDKPLGESYIRHHPNPKIRAPPQHYEIANPEVAFKQKVVHQQFHTGYCSEQDIEETVKCQASNIPIFLDFSFLKQKQEIEDQARRMREQARETAAKNWAAKAH